MGVAGRFQVLQVTRVVLVRKKCSLAVVTALDDVLWNAGQMVTAVAGHVGYSGE